MEWASTPFTSGRGSFGTFSTTEGTFFLPPSQLTSDPVYSLRSSFTSSPVALPALTCRPLSLSLSVISSNSLVTQRRTSPSRTTSSCPISRPPLTESIISSRPCWASSPPASTRSDWALQADERSFEEAKSWRTIGIAFRDSMRESEGNCWAGRGYSEGGSGLRSL